MPTVALAPWLSPHHPAAEQLLAAQGLTLDPTLAEYGHAQLLSAAEAAAILDDLHGAEHERQAIQHELSQAEPGSPLAQELTPGGFHANSVLLKANLQGHPDALLFLLLREQAKRRRKGTAAPAPLAAALKPASTPRKAQPQRGATRRGRPSNTAEVPGIYSNRRLNHALVAAGLTTAERTVALRILSLLRAQYVKDQRGRILNRESLGKRSHVANVFRKLQRAELITPTHRVSGVATRGLNRGVTNLGPAFLALNTSRDTPKSKTAQGQIRDPRTSNFDSPKPIAMTGFPQAERDPLFRNPLKGVPIGPGPTASAALRATASEPAPPEQKNQHKINSSVPAQRDQVQSSSMSIVDQFPIGTIVEVNGYSGLFKVRTSLMWDEGQANDCVRCSSVEDPDCWITAKLASLSTAPLAG